MIFTFLDQPTIEGLIELHHKDLSQRILQKKLAEEVTRLVHGEEKLQAALETTKKLFSNADKPVSEMSAEELEGMDGIVKSTFALSTLRQGIDVVSFLADTQIFPSKGEARKMLQNGGVSINREKVGDSQQSINEKMLLHGKYLLVQKGKKNFYLVEAG